MPVVLFAGWTLFVWGTRIRNAEGAVGATTLALSFVALAIVVLVLRWRGGRRSATNAVRALAAWTTGVWAVRVVGIWLHDRSVAFKVVHTVLAVVSIALAAWAVWAERAQAPAMASSVSGSKK